MGKRINAAVFSALASVSTLGFAACSRSPVQDIGKEPASTTSTLYKIKPKTEITVVGHEGDVQFAVGVRIQLSPNMTDEQIVKFSKAIDDARNASAISTSNGGRGIEFSNPNDFKGDRIIFTEKGEILFPFFAVFPRGERDVKEFLYGAEGTAKNPKETSFSSNIAAITNYTLKLLGYDGPPTIAKAEWKNDEIEIPQGLMLYPAEVPDNNLNKPEVTIPKTTLAR